MYAFFGSDETAFANTLVDGESDFLQNGSVEERQPKFAQGFKL